MLGGGKRFHQLYFRGLQSFSYAVSLDKLSYFSTHHVRAQQLTCVAIKHGFHNSSGSPSAIALRFQQTGMSRHCYTPVPERRFG